MMRRAALLVVGFVAACGTPPGPVRWSGAPPAYTAKDYDTVHDRWTRRAHATRSLLKGPETTLDATVTLLSDDFRAAYLAKVSAMRDLTAAQRAQLATDAGQDAASYLEMVVSLQASRWEWLQLSSHTSEWSVTLVDDQGHELAPTEILQVETRQWSLEELYPPVTPFSRHWRLRFKRALPDGSQLAGPDTKWIKLRFAGPLGHEELTW